MIHRLGSEDTTIWPHWAAAANWTRYCKPSAPTPDEPSQATTYPAIVVLVGVFFAFDPGRFFSLDHFKSQQATIDAYRAEHAGLTARLYFLIYVAVTGLSLPGAAILTLAAGAIFGLPWGTVIVSFASTLGATLAFLTARLVLRDWVRGKFGDKLKATNAGMEKEGGFYLFTLRLIPIFPFFAINLVISLRRSGPG